jgi:hypothetical protein
MPCVPHTSLALLDDDTWSIDASIRSQVAMLDARDLLVDYWRHEELAVIPEFVSAPVVERIGAEIADGRRRLVRKHLPGYKASSSMSYGSLRALSPTAIELYRSAVLRAFLSSLSEMTLELCPDDDPHACAVYHYDREGDRVGWHYDTSWYRGARYTVLIGIEDRSRARLQCRLYSRDRHRPRQDLLVATTPGTLVFFNGDKLLHQVTPLGSEERRTVLSLQYVTDPAMSGWRRVVSRIKDRFAYFGREPRLPSDSAALARR